MKHLRGIENETRSGSAGLTHMTCPYAIGNFQTSRSKQIHRSMFSLIPISVSDLYSAFMQFIIYKWFSLVNLLRIMQIGCASV